MNIMYPLLACTIFALYSLLAHPMNIYLTMLLHCSHYPSTRSFAWPILIMHMWLSYTSCWPVPHLHCIATWPHPSIHTLAHYSLLQLIPVRHTLMSCRYCPAIPTYTSFTILHCSRYHPHMIVGHGQYSCYMDEFHGAIAGLY